MVTTQVAHKVSRLVELWVYRTDAKPKAHFLYRNFPTRWHENWRNISGFYVRRFGYSIMLAVWR